MNKKVILIILDGWGIATNPNVSAIDQANTPFVDSLFKNYTNSKLEASGIAVGLPTGQMGNSEVGHMNIGAGRVVYQDLVRVNVAIEEKTLDSNPVLSEALRYAVANNKKVHFMGLLSDGGVHSHIEHLKGLCTIADSNGIKDLFIHAFTDGRDTDPKGGVNYLNDLQNHLDKTTGKVASVTGRYYAMDRDNRWERIKLAYDAMVHGTGIRTNDVVSEVKKSYDANVSDEFIMPIIKVDELGKPLAVIEKDDVVICFNFRTDRGRQITQVLTQKDMPEFNMQKLNLHYVTLTNYDHTFDLVKPIFEKDNLENTLGEAISKAEKAQIRIAETEKYPHVTFFFSGGRETIFAGEHRLMCPSPKVATYDLMPEMSAYGITNLILPEIRKQEVDFVCLNFANADMVGHTGDFQAAVKACEVVDDCTKKVVEEALNNNYTCIVIADHGNSDCMINADGTPNTAHTTNLVPCILVDKDFQPQLNDGKLGDIAPTILRLMNISIPQQMTGNVLF